MNVSSPGYRLYLIGAIVNPETEQASEGLGLGKLFADPNMIGKLAANPKTAKHLADQSFVQKLQFIQKNPKLAEGALQDPRMIEVLGVLMGVDINAFSRPEGSEELPPGVVAENLPDFQPSTSTSPPPPAQASSSNRTPPPARAPEAKVEEVEMDVDDEDAQAKKSAEAEKKLGSEAYKKREFEPAAAHFQKAWDLWPKDMTYLTNLAGQCFFCRRK